MYLKNIKVGYVMSFLAELYFPIAIWLFFYLKFLTFKEIALLGVIKIIFTNIFEIPTGAFADKYGRKLSISISFLLYACVMLGFVFAKSLGLFIILEIVKALAIAFYSGSLEALMYDSLKKESREQEYDNVISKNQSLEWTALFVSAIISGFLFHIWYPAPYLIQFFIYIFAFFISFTFIETTFKKQAHNAFDFIKQNIVGIRELFSSKRLASLTIIFVTLGAGYFFASELLGISQIREYGGDGRLTGIVFGTGYIISALASKYYPALLKFFGKKILFILTIVALLSSFLLAKFVWLTLGIGLIILRISSSTTFRNIRSSTINRFISSENRATTLSSLNLLTQLPFAVFGFFAGVFIEAFSPNQFAFLLGVIISIIIIIVISLFKKLKSTSIFKLEITF